MNLYTGFKPGHGEMAGFQKATPQEELQDALTCRTCSGSGEKDSSCPTAEGPCGYTVKCPDCVDGIPRWAIETVADALTLTPGSYTNRHREAAVVVLVALRDREETE